MTSLAAEFAQEGIPMSGTENLPEVPIVQGSKEHAEPGDFEVSVLTKGGANGVRVVSVPRDVYEMLNEASIERASQFPVYVSHFPGAVARSLGWTTEDVELAIDRMFMALEGVVSRHRLMRHVPRVHPTGVVRASNR